ncbi:MAG: RluA family pseudouridine synthase [Proteobacteria bacterium]|nr:RluA family pseudouridine synthase [Pseudomonadota bacterium]
MTTHSPRSWIVEAADADQRLDRFLAERLDLSRAQVRRLLAEGAVRLGDQEASARHKGTPLRVGDRVVVAAHRSPADQRIRPEPDRPLSVLTEGEGWLAVDKPAGWPVHPFREDETGTVLNAVAARRPELQGVGEGGLRSGVVHRLDVQTSGVLLVASAPAAWEWLRAAFRSHRVAKRYRALVLGRVEEAAELAVTLQIAQHRPARVRVVPEGTPGARRTELAWTPLEHWPDATLLEVRPRTGFLHQIRATLADRGHPVLGDALYGGDGAACPVPADRHLLHAAGVRVGDVAAESPDPADFAAALQALRVRL